MSEKETSANTSTTYRIPSGGYPDCFFYDPGEQKYLVVNPAHVAQFVMSVKKLDEFQVQIATARAEKPSAKKTERLEGIGKYIDEHINGTTQKPVIKKGIAGLIPLLLTNGTVSLYDRPLVFARRHDLDKMKWVDAEDPEVAKRFKLINDRLEKRMEDAIKTRKKKEEEEKNKTGKEKKDALKEKWAAVETSCGWKLWTLKNKDGKPFDGRLVKNWILQPDSELGKDSRYFSAKPEVQFLRYTLTAEAGAKWDPKGGSMKLSAEGSAKFNLVDAKVTGEVFLPCKDGVDLFGIVRAATNKAKVESALKPDAKFFVRLKYCLTGFAYAGVSATASVAIPEIDYSDFVKEREKKTPPPKDEKKEIKAKVGAEGEVFAGAKAGVSLAEEFEWHDGSKTPVEFSTLSSIKWTGSGQIGIGIGGALALRYENGSFTFEMYLQVTLKLGLSGKFEVELDIEQAYKIITHLARNVEYHKIPGLTAEGFKKLADYGLAKAINAKNMAIDAWDSAYQATSKAAEQTYEKTRKELLAKRKEIEDTLEVLYNDVNNTKSEILNTLYKEQDEIEARLVKVKNECLRKKKEFCREIESIASQVSDFKAWFRSKSKKEIDEIRDLLVSNIDNWKDSYFQMLLPETAGTILALLGGGKSLQKIDKVYQDAIVTISELFESTHERVHVLDTFARELLDISVNTATEAVSEGKRVITNWVDDVSDVATYLYHDITN